jgi:hypothetical protein
MSPHSLISLVFAVTVLRFADAASAEVPRREFLEQHCYDCHDAETKKGKLDLTALTFDSANVATWVKVHDAVERGEMRPKTKADGTIKTELYSDGHLHLGPAGYEVFASKLKPAVAK